MPGDRRVARQRHHRVAVAAEHERVHVLDRDVQLHRDERAHPRRVEHARHADDALARELAQPVDRLAHRVERVRDRHDDRVRRVLDDLLGHRLHDLVVASQQVVAAHARLARHAGRDHHDVGVGRLLPALVGRAVADDARVRPFDRAGLEHVERDARRLRFGDVDDDDVGKLLVGDGARHRRADVAGAAHNGHFTIHVSSPPQLPASSFQRIGSSIPVDFAANRFCDAAESTRATGRQLEAGSWQLFHMFAMMASANSDVFSSSRRPSAARSRR